MAVNVLTVGAQWFPLVMLMLENAAQLTNSGSFAKQLYLQNPTIPHYSVNFFDPSARSLRLEIEGYYLSSP